MNHKEVYLIIQDTKMAAINPLRKFLLNCNQSAYNKLIKQFLTEMLSKGIIRK